MTPDLDCIELVEMTTDYFEGALRPGDVARLESHLTECDGCTEYIRQMRLTQEALGHVDAALIAPPARARLLAAFRAWKSETRDG
jgi:predicted anti-sigma-YlaC factor YlaD